MAAAVAPCLRAGLASITGVDVRAILELTNRADLARIKRVGSVYSDLLERAGVDTVKELAVCRPENLLLKIEEINQAGGYTRQLPAVSTVKSWIELAKTLPRMIEY